MTVLFFFISTTVLLVTITAVRPPWTNKPAVLRPPWLPVMLVNELAPLILCVVAVLAAVALALGTFAGSLGMLSLWMTVCSVGLLIWMIVRSARTGATMRRALGTRGPADRTVGVSWVDALWPYPYRLPSDGVMTENVEYTPGYALDVYAARVSGRVGAAPAMLHVHGGSWSGGDRRQQARPFIHELARRGWVVVSIDYPLVPEATFPEPLDAIHHAFAWLRDNATSLGIDPSLIHVTGGSSGAHLAALAALTDRDRTIDSEPASAPIAGAVTLYGVYDLLNRRGNRDDWPIIPRGLIKADPTSEPSKFTVASPIDRVHPDAPPFVVIHGDHDSLVPVTESVFFVEALERTSTNPVDLIRLKGASHAFDALPSIRTQMMVQAVADHLDARVEAKIESLRGDPD